MAATGFGTVFGFQFTFGALHPLVTLVPLSVTAGVGMLWMFGRFSNQRVLIETRRRLQAHMYEMRLFVDEPVLIWRAQIALFRDSARYFGLTVIPVTLIAIIFMPVFFCLDCLYGQSPLKPGTRGVVTVQLRRNVPGNSALLHLPDAFIIDTPPVRVVAENQISWGFRALRAGSGQLRITVADETATKNIVSASDWGYVSKRRDSSVLGWIRNPAEPPLRTASINWIEVNFPAAEIVWLGVTLHWTVWFLIISMTAAFVMRHRLGVRF